MAPPPVLPAGTIKGVIGISGVYTLLRPLGGALSFYKNHIFDKYMRRETFGDDLNTLVKFSPTALVRLGAGELTPFKPRWSEVLGKLAQDSLSVVTVLAPWQTKQKHDEAAAAWAAGGAPAGVSWARDLPPFLLVNASWDLGLEDDAAYFAKVLKDRTGTKPAHHTIPNTNHGTVCWDEATFHRCREFLTNCEASNAHSRACGGSDEATRETPKCGEAEGGRIR